MAKFALLNAFCFAGGYDFTGDTNQIQLTVEAETLDVTTFGSGGWTENVGGLKTSSLELAGYWDAGTGTVDPEAFAALTAGDVVHTVGAAATETQPVYGFLASRYGYTLGGEIGQAAPFSLTSQGASAYGMVRGQLAKAKGSVAATGVLGSVLNLGAPTATQRVYAGLHAFGTPGTSLTVQVQSDDSAGMASPTTRGTLGPVTTAGGSWLAPVAGPFTGETHWRFNVSAITGTWTVAGFIAVQ